MSAEELLGQPQVQITVDRAAIARYGLAVSDVQQVIETALGGSVATQVLEGERTFDLVVKLSPKAVSDLDAIRNIPVFGSNGERLTLGTLASVDVRAGLRSDLARGKCPAHGGEIFRARPRPRLAGCRGAAKGRPVVSFRRATVWNGRAPLKISSAPCGGWRSSCRSR